MKSLSASVGLLLALCAAAVGAQSPDGFALRAPLTTERDAGLHVLQIDEALYRAAARVDLRDLRVFNAAGEALPLARLPAPPWAAPSLAEPVGVTLVALPAQRADRDQTLADFALRVEKDGARAVVEVRPTAAPAAAATAQVGGYLLDLRGQRDRDGVLRLRFAEQAADFTGRIEFLGGDDLVDWRPLASGPLVRNRQLGEAVERNEFELMRVPPFMRVQWSGATPELAGATFATRVPTGPDPLPRVRLAVARGETPGNYLVEVPIALPIVQLQLRTLRDNMAVRVRLWRYEERGTPPRPRVGLTPRQAPEHWVQEGAPRDVFRLEREGGVIESPPFALSVPTTLLRPETVGAGGFGDDLPIMEAEWKPARYAFVARPPAPYAVAVGLAAASAGPTLDLGAILAADDPAGLRLPWAYIEAEGAASTRAAARAQRIVEQAAWSRYLLWGVLVGAIGLLAFMTWRIAAQLRTAGVNSPCSDGDAPK
jgi:hypothetical protein